MLARSPSLLRVRRAADVILPVLVPDISQTAVAATTTTTARTGSSHSITPSIARSVTTLTTSGIPAVTATSCRRPTFFFQAEDGIRVFHVTGVQTCALPI